MNIVNLIHIGEEIKNLDELSQEEKQMYALALNIQGLEPLGYDVSAARDVLNRLKRGEEGIGNKD